MSWVRITRILDRDQAINGLAHLRQEWQLAADGKPLMDVQGNVGLLLADVVAAIDLLPEEAAQVLGSEVAYDPAHLRLSV
jgi:hypothetical protein